MSTEGSEIWVVRVENRTGLFFRQRHIRIELQGAEIPVGIFEHSLAEEGIPKHELNALVGWRGDNPRLPSARNTFVSGWITGIDLFAGAWILRPVIDLPQRYNLGLREAFRVLGSLAGKHSRIKT